jgi:hypothetical protein
MAYLRAVRLSRATPKGHSISKLGVCRWQTPSFKCEKADLYLCQCAGLPPIMPCTCYAGPVVLLNVGEVTKRGVTNIPRSTCGAILDIQPSTPLSSRPLTTTKACYSLPYTITKASPTNVYKMVGGLQLGPRTRIDPEVQENFDS